MAFRQPGVWPFEMHGGALPDWTDAADNVKENAGTATVP
jgi:hypothetical protein